MAKSRLAIVPKKPAAVVDRKPENISVPASVEHVLYDIQQQLFQINATVASVHALAEAKDCDSDVRWALEGVLRSFESLVDDDLTRIVITRAITLTAKEREGVDHGC